MNNNETISFILNDLDTENSDIPLCENHIYINGKPYSINAPINWRQNNIQAFAEKFLSEDNINIHGFLEDKINKIIHYKSEIQEVAGNLHKTLKAHLVNSIINLRIFPNFELFNNPPKFFKNYSKIEYIDNIDEIKRLLEQEYKQSFEGEFKKIGKTQIYKIFNELKEVYDSHDSNYQICLDNNYKIICADALSCNISKDIINYMLVCLNNNINFIEYFIDEPQDINKNFFLNYDDWSELQNPHYFSKLLLNLPKKIIINQTDIFDSVININLENYINNGNFNFKLLTIDTEIWSFALSILLEKKSAKIGITGLCSAVLSCGYNFDSEEAIILTERIFSTIEQAISKYNLEMQAQTNIEYNIIMGTESIGINPIQPYNFNSIFDNRSTINLLDLSCITEYIIFNETIEPELLQAIDQKNDSKISYNEYKNIMDIIGIKEENYKNEIYDIAKKYFRSGNFYNLNINNKSFNKAAEYAIKNQWPSVNITSN